jgi:hypothetical protein
VAIATALTVADTYGWYVRNTQHASCSALIAANSAASGRVGKEGTGIVGDGRAAGDELHGVIAPANGTGGTVLTAGVKVFSPYCDNSTGA